MTERKRQAAYLLQRTQMTPRAWPTSAYRGGAGLGHNRVVEVAMVLSLVSTAAIVGSLMVVHASSAGWGRRLGVRSVGWLPVAVASVALATMGCGTPELPSAASSPLGQTPIVAPGGSATPSTFPSPMASTPLPTPTNSPGSTSSVDQAGIFPGGLWALRGSTLLVSADAGANWRRSTIPIRFDPLRISIFVLDRTHAWSVTPGPGSTEFTGSANDALHLIVHRTSDGGGTWQQSTVPGSYPGTGPQLVFVDTLRGYLLCSALRPSNGRSTVLRTDDGGRSWSVAGTGDWLGSMFAASDPTTVWAGAEVESGPIMRPLLDVSRDGGRTWTPIPLPALGDALPPGQGGADRFLPEPPEFFDASRGIVSISSANSDSSVTTFYRTDDGGRTWTKAGQLAYLAWVGQAMLTARTWLIPRSDRSGLEATADGGATWQPVASHAAPPDEQVDWIGAIDTTHAAMLVSGPQAGSELLLTADAGRTWLPAGFDAAATAPGG